MRISGKLKKAGIEGGVWLLVGDDGKRFQLTPAPVGHADGDRVDVEGDVNTAAVSFQMAGPILVVRTIRKA